MQTSHESKLGSFVCLFQVSIYPQARLVIVRSHSFLCIYLRCVARRTLYGYDYIILAFVDTLYIHDV